MKKLNREVVAKNSSRFFLVLMSFMLILSLCSATAPSVSVPLLIQNPDNIPQNYSFSLCDSDLPIDFGSNYVDAYYIQVVDGLIDDEPVDIPDGDYYTFGVKIIQPLGSTSLSFSGDLFEYDGYPVYLTDSPTITVIDGKPTDLQLLVFFFVPVNMTDSITSVWTSITNWVISSFNTVQGVFYGAGEEVITPDTSSSDTVVYNGVTYYPIDYLRGEESDSSVAYFNGVELNQYNTASSQIDINGVTFQAASTNNNVFLLVDTNTESTYSPVGMEIVISSEGSFTLLGTLAVIGLSISLTFLVIGVISRLLKLRG